MPEHPSSWRECPPLNEENSQLLGLYISGIKRALLSDFPHTVEAREKQGDAGIFKLPQPKYLKRIIFMKGGNRFRVAVTLNAHLLDEETAENITPTEAENLQPVWPDGIRVFLVDDEMHNLMLEDITYQNSLGRSDTSGVKEGFRINNNLSYSYPGIEWGVYRLRAGLDAKIGITEDHFKELDPKRIIIETLHTGGLDSDADQRFRELVEDDIAARLIDGNYEALMNSLPYLNNILDVSLNRKLLEPMFIWNQYWDQRS